MPAIVFARLKNGKAAAALVPIAALAALHRLEGKRMLRDVLRTRSLGFTMMEETHPSS